MGPWNGVICGSFSRSPAKERSAPPREKSARPSRPWVGGFPRSKAALGQTLFQRTADGFVLTDEGTAVLRHAERIEAEAVALERRLSGAKPNSTACCACRPRSWFGARMLSPAIAAFGKRHPKVWSSF